MHREGAAGPGWAGPTLTAWRLSQGRGETFNGCTKLTCKLGFKLYPSQPEGQASLKLTTLPGSHCPEDKAQGPSLACEAPAAPPGLTAPALHADPSHELRKPHSPAPPPPGPVLLFKAFLNLP